MLEVLPPWAAAGATAPRSIQALILENTLIAPDHFIMRLRAPDVSTGFPGQFVMIRPAPKTFLHPVLPRPMAVYRYFPKSQEIELAYRVIGEGTKIMSERRAGDETEIVGPAGHPFVIEDETSGILVIGRGIGMCSLTAVVDEARRRGIRVYGVVSAREPEVVLGEQILREGGAEFISVNDRDGTSKVADVRAWIDGIIGPGLAQQAFVCGSNRLIATTALAAAGSDVEVQVSLEARMACGIGYCHGCATGAFGQLDESPLVCRDGPVFRCRSVAG